MRAGGGGGAVALLAGGGGGAIDLLAGGGGGGVAVQGSGGGVGYGVCRWRRGGSHGREWNPRRLGFTSGCFWPS